MRTTPTTLLGTGKATVIGLPRRFTLPRALRTAKRIRMATAFAHMSGWQLIAPHIVRSNAQVEILTGLDFCQTEPAVLREWLKLSRTGRVKAYLYRGSSPTFHPKVLIVESRSLRFAIVGSANLSAGGLRDNIECSVYTNHLPTLTKLGEWFDREMYQSNEINQEDIDEYEPKHKAAQKAKRVVQAQQREAEEKIASKHRSRSQTWQDAVRRGKRYFSSKQFRNNDRRQWAHAARSIRKLLHLPTFNFNRTDWRKFFEVEELGNVVPIHSNKLFRRKKLLQKALRHLIDESVPIQERITTVLDSAQPFALKGLGINIVTKILAAHRPNKWPVFNGPVKEVIGGFGYEEPHGADIGGKYAAFSHLMGKFKQQTSAPDILSLDCFFYRQSQVDE